MAEGSVPVVKNFFEQFLNVVKASWLKWTNVQKGIFLAVVLAGALGVWALASFNVKPSTVVIFGSKITDEQLRANITTVLDREGIKYTASADGQTFYVADEKLARKARTLLVREGLTPGQVDPWSLFDMQRWTTTKMEQDVNLQRSVSRQLKQHIESLDDIDKAEVAIAFPKDQLFQEDKSPVTASVVLLVKPGSDMSTNQRKIQGIVRLVQFAVPELKSENITITDSNGNLLNDFSMLSVQDRWDQINVMLSKKQQIEKDYYKKIMEAGNAIAPGRVRVLNVDYTPNADEVTQTKTEITPIELVPQDPTKPYDTRKVVENIKKSEQSASVDYKGTGFNPEGPPGQEGQTPPAYQDLQNTTGIYNQSTNTTNYINNQTDSFVKGSGWKKEKVAVSVAIDGTYKYEFDEKGQRILEKDGSVKRTYIPISDEEIEKLRNLIKVAVGADVVRGDQVAVEEMKFDRTAQFLQEDADYRRQLLIKQSITWMLLGLVLLLIMFMVIRIIAREKERRRRLREEELARQHQAMREAALRSMETEQDQQLSNERPRNELQERTLALARERPEDVALLIRTWLSDD
jgi:flagellar M-ring protein FliF